GLQAAVAAHVVDYDGAVAQLCVEALAAQSCDLTTSDARTAPSACTRMFRGTRAALLACAFDAECASGVCEIGECPPAGCCSGTCRALQPPAGIDRPCVRATDCDDGLVCASN